MRYLMQNKQTKESKETYQVLPTILRHYHLYQHKYNIQSFHLVSDIVHCVHNNHSAMYKK